MIKGGSSLVNLLLFIFALLVSCASSTSETNDAGLDGDVTEDADEAADAEVVEPATWAIEIYGEASRQYANAFAEAVDGGIYLGGFNAGSGSGDSNGWLAKVDAEGELLWEGLMGTWITSLASRDDGGVIAVGDVSGDRDSALVAAIDAQGQPLWRLQWEIGPGREWPNRMSSVLATAEGTFIALGTLPRPYATGSSHIFLAEITNDGTILWQETLAAAEIDRSMLLAAQNGDIILAARLHTDLTLLARLDRAGAPRWWHAFETVATMNNDSVDVAETPAGDILMATSTSSRIVLIQLDQDGEFLWQRGYSIVGADYGRGLIVNDDGSIVMIAGALSSTNGPDMALLHLTPDGDVEGASWYPHVGCEMPRGLRRTDDGGLLTATGGCLYTALLRLDSEGTLDADCDLLQPTTADAIELSLPASTIELIDEPTELEPSLVQPTLDPTTSRVERICN